MFVLDILGRRHLKNPADLACPWEWLSLQGSPVPSWLLAEKLIEHGFCGIAVKSFAEGAKDEAINFVLWEWNEDNVQVIDDFSRLPKNQDSWRP